MSALTQAFFVIKALDKFGNAVPVPSAADGSRSFKAEISGAQARTARPCSDTSSRNMQPLQDCACSCRLRLVSDLTIQYSSHSCHKARASLVVVLTRIRQHRT